MLQNSAFWPRRAIKLAFHPIRNPPIRSSWNPNPSRKASARRAQKWGRAVPNSVSDASAPVPFAIRPTDGLRQTRVPKNQKTPPPWNVGGENWPVDVGFGKRAFGRIFPGVGCAVRPTERHTDSSGGIATFCRRGTRVRPDRPSKPSQRRRAGSPKLRQSRPWRGWQRSVFGLFAWNRFGPPPPYTGGWFPRPWISATFYPFLPSASSPSAVNCPRDNTVCAPRILLKTPLKENGGSPPMGLGPRVWQIGINAPILGSKASPPVGASRGTAYLPLQRSYGFLLAQIPRGKGHGDQHQYVHKGIQGQPFAPRPRNGHRGYVVRFGIQGQPIPTGL